MFKVFSLPIGERFSYVKQAPLQSSYSFNTFIPAAPYKQSTFSTYSNHTYHAFSLIGEGSRHSHFNFPYPVFLNFPRGAPPWLHVIWVVSVHIRSYPFISFHISSVSNDRGQTFNRGWTVICSPSVEACPGADILILIYMIFQRCSFSIVLMFSLILEWGSPAGDQYTR